MPHNLRGVVTVKTDLNGRMHLYVDGKYVPGVVRMNYQHDYNDRSGEGRRDRGWLTVEIIGDVVTFETPPAEYWKRS
jgi:hypothetical protein